MGYVVRIACYIGPTTAISAAVPALREILSRYMYMKRPLGPVLSCSDAQNVQ